MTISEIIISVIGILSTFLMAITKDIIALKNKKNDYVQRLTEEEIKRKYKIEEELHELIFNMQEQHSENFNQITDIVSRKYDLDSEFMSEIFDAILIKNNSRFDYLSEMYYPKISLKYKEIVDISAVLIKKITDYKIAQKYFSLEDVKIIYAEYNQIGHLLTILKQEFMENSRNNRMDFLKKNTMLLE